MIREVRIENYKSISELDLKLGRINVLIGANGSGKSNILEAIALAAAAPQRKLDNEFLSARGVRATEAMLMRSAFAETAQQSRREVPETETVAIGESGGGGVPSSKRIHLAVRDDGGSLLRFMLWADESSTYPRWRCRISIPAGDWLRAIRSAIARSGDGTGDGSLDAISGFISPDVFDSAYRELAGVLPDFLVYYPENSALRNFQAEGQVLPLGIRGEGLFAHLKGLNTERHRDRLERIQEKLRLLDWFESFDIPEDLGPGERTLRLRDCFLKEGVHFDQRSANEGFLFLLFYLTLFISPETPAFFAIDNIDSSLNPKLCWVLLDKLVGLAKEYDKQVIVTTHNPAVLDGLDLNDDEQRLFVVDRSPEGHTKVRRISAPKPLPGRSAGNLSEAFLRGYIGGLPKNF